MLNRLLDIIIAKVVKCLIYLRKPAAKGERVYVGSYLHTKY